MPLASLSAGAAALLGAAASAAAGGIAAVAKSGSEGKQRKHEKDLQTIHTTEPGFEDFGDEMVDETTDEDQFSLMDKDLFSLTNAKRPVIFPNNRMMNRRI